MCCLIKCLFGFIRFLINLLFFLAGAAFLVVAFMLLASKRMDDYVLISGMNDETFMISLYVLIVLGFAVIGVAIIGWIADCCSSKILIWIYIIANIVVIVAVGACVGVVIWYGETISQDEIQSNMLTNIDNTNDDMPLTWDNVQVWLDCCGSTGYKDWENSTLGNNHTVPWSCCAMDTKWEFTIDNVVSLDACQAEAAAGTPSGELNALGCAKEVTDWFAVITMAVWISLVIAMCIQILGVIMACVNSCTLNSSKTGPV